MTSTSRGSPLRSATAAAFRGIERFRIFVLLGAAVVAAASASPQFLTVVNIRGLLNVASTNVLVAAGLTIVMIAGEIDLSVGSTLALTGMIAMVLQPLGVELAVLVALAVGMGIGLVNGLLVSRLRISSILVTIGTMIVIKGIALSVADGQNVSGSDLRASLAVQSPVLGLLSPTSLVAVVVITALHVVLWQTVQGRTLYVIGGSEDRGRLSGIPAERYLIAGFMVSGVMAALAGSLLSLGLFTGSPYFGDSTAFTVIAGVVVGGTSLLGAEGSVLRSALGVLLLAIVANVFSISGVPTFILSIVTGAILLAVVLLDSYLGHRRRRDWLLRRITRRDVGPMIHPEHPAAGEIAHGS
jgi:ribose/xylose/arabinose/galactoside ABC-type transport system permease subunit